MKESGILSGIGDGSAGSLRVDVFDAEGTRLRTYTIHLSCFGRALDDEEAESLALAQAREDGLLPDGRAGELVARARPQGR